MNKKKICIIGLGYIGLPTAAMFATHGHKIIGVDINKKIVDALNMGEITIEEPYLDKMVKAAVLSGNLRASYKTEEADVFIIAVGTPVNEDKTANMDAVIQAAESIVPVLREGNIVILESTSPPGTVNNLLCPILAKSGLDIGEQVLVAHCPERVLPGRILLELVENNKLIGGINQKSSEAVKELYSTFVKGEIYLTDATTAEMCKLMENTFRDVNIALANELALLCEDLGINAWDVIQLSNKHPRVNLHQPGPGVGGHCIAVDPWFIVEKSPELSRIIRLSRQINDEMPRYVYKKSRKIMGPGHKKITILGVTYKPNVDDIRESPILKLIEYFEDDGDIELAAYDPHVAELPYKASNLYEAASGSHLVILAVHHDQFKRVDFRKLASVMAAPNVLDTRNFWDENTVTASGLSYYLLGNGKTGIAITKE